MNEPDARTLLEKVLSFCDAEAVTAVLDGEGGGSTRFADNVITQNVATDTVSVGVTCAYGQSHGSATTNELGDEALQSLATRAQAIAKVSPPDPEYMPPVEADEAQKYASVQAFHEATARMDPTAKAEQIRDAAEAVDVRGWRLSGAYPSGQSFVALANSAGLRAYHRRTDAEIHTSVLTPTGSGWAEKHAGDVAAIDVQKVVDRALNVAAASQNPADSVAGDYTVILSPAAIGDLLMMLMWGGFEAKATDEGRTCLRGKLGTPIAGENVTIRSATADPRCPGHPFQGDGLASPDVAWIDKGVLANLCYSRYWAKKQGKTATGMPANIIMDGGETTIDQMIASTGRGLLITRLWYIRFIDPMKPTVTGMTRDGLFLIEDGKATRSLKNMRFNINLLDILGRVEALGVPERTGEYIHMLVPPVKIRDFTFGSTTRF